MYIFKHWLLKGYFMMNAELLKKIVRKKIVIFSDFSMVEFCLFILI